MPFDRPTLPRLIERVGQDIASRTARTPMPLPGSPDRVLATALAGASHLLHAHLDWLSRQFLPDTADADWLERHASIWLQSGRKPAGFAIGTVAFTGAAGSTAPAGTLLQRADGVQYLTDLDATIGAGGSATVSVTALAAGATGNLAAGSTLSLVSPVLGVDSAVTAAGEGVVGGADAESDGELRARVLERIRNPPQGGSKSDYVRWALEVSGVTRAWCLPNHLGVGTVVVLFVRDDDASPIPDAAEVAVVQAYIDERRPVTAEVSAVAPIAKPTAYQIQLTPATAAVKAAVEAGLRDLHRREGEPGVTLLLSHIREAISLAAGETDHVLVAPSANVTHQPYELPTFGGITWL
ncbi:baseplate J/gp47 family protein [Crenobacter cavernae]|uniref:Baseplate J protein n=1 Tax=Crenobacter cavernae TaxID=2290923 RepID=A0A345Y6R1_9NEIS|nr:baseplate J/gp47 family protein [Crenobacter cavernae]AXK39613.1 baseplate J protein [Crenobacter cavernae]